MFTDFKTNEITGPRQTGGPVLRSAVSGSFKQAVTRFRRRIMSILLPNRVNAGSFTLHKYLKKDGSFDYEMYRRIQTEGNRQKLNRVWAIEENIAFLSDYIKSLVGTPQFGICHGTRRGLEQQWFRKYLNCEVIGTEISDTADQFPHTIEWDFHEVKPEWINAVDFIYSNSFDHTYDAEKCLNQWMSCVKPGGVCIIEHSSEDVPSWATELDPFGADIVCMPYLILTWGQGKYAVRQILKAPASHEHLAYLYFLVIQRFEEPQFKA